MFDKSTSSKGSYYQLLSIIKTQTLSNCNRRNGVSKDLLPLVTSFYERIDTSNINWNDQLSTIFTNIANVVMELVYTAKAGQTISIAEMEGIIKVFDVVNIISDSSIEILSIANNREKNHKWQSQFDKINFLHQIFSNNSIFNGYEDLGNLFEYLNDNWDDLVKRGLSKKVITDFKSFLDYNSKNHNVITKNEKINLLFGILNGSMKFQPQYEMKAVGYQIIPVDSDESFISNIGTEFSKGYSLKPKE